MPEKHKRQRFPMLIGTLGRVLLIPFGVTRQRAFVEIREDELHVRFGPVFDHRFPLSEIEEAVPAVWPFWAGIGPRANFGGAVGMVGAYANTVMMRFKTPQEVRLFVIPVSCQRLYVSLEDPEAFMAALVKAQEQPLRPLQPVRVA